MKTKLCLGSILLLLTFSLIACNNAKGTNIVQNPPTPAKPNPAIIISPTNTVLAVTDTLPANPTIVIKQASSTVEIPPKYFDGIIVLTQYYTLLDHGFYDEVLPLYSSSLLAQTGGKNFEVDLKSVKIQSIYPYDYWLAQQGQPPANIPENELRFVVGTTVFHNSPVWNPGGTPTPDNVTRFVSLIMENDMWKLKEFNSSPWFK